MSMKHRWMDAMKRGLVSSSPRSTGSSPHDASASSTASASSKDSNNPPSLGARRSFALALAGISTALDDDIGDTSPVAFVHFAERCESVGVCSVSKVLELCMLQGGVHHTHMNLLTYLGSPLRVDTCCYVMSVQWFRALGDRDDFQLIPDACDEWFTPTADDIGAKILAKVAMQGEDAVHTKLLEYGPIKEDPEVRSKVETYLERRSVLFMGLESLAVQDGGEHYPNNIDMRESWTLLIDDRRVRLTCESSLLPPFEGFYTSSIRVEIVRCSPHEFYLFLAENCYVHLRAASNTVRDIIVLTLRAFCRSAVSSELINDAIAKGLSPMLTIRTLAAAEQQHDNGQQGQQETLQKEPLLVKSPPTFSLPWNQASVGAGGILIDEDQESEDNESVRLSETGGITRLRATSDSLSVTSTTDYSNDPVMQDADALIGHAMKMGLQNHLLLPKAPKWISVTEIPDLQIIEAVGNNGGKEEGTALRSPPRRRVPRKNSLADSDWRSRSSSLDAPPSIGVSESHHISSNGSEETSHVRQDTETPMPEADESESLDTAIRTFQHHHFEEIEALQSQYVSIFCALQRELSESKARAKRMSERLNDTTETNSAFRRDVALLQDALSSVQFADQVRAVVTKDVQHLLKRTTPATTEPSSATKEHFF